MTKVYCSLFFDSNLSWEKLQESVGAHCEKHGVGEFILLSHDRLSSRADAWAKAILSRPDEEPFKKSARFVIPPIFKFFHALIAAFALLRGSQMKFPRFHLKVDEGVDLEKAISFVSELGALTNGKNFLFLRDVNFNGIGVFTKGKFVETLSFASSKPDDFNFSEQGFQSFFIADMVTYNTPFLKFMKKMEGIDKTKDFKAALKLIKKQLERYPFNSTLHKLLGIVYRELGQETLSAESFEKATRFDGKESLNELRKSLADLGENIEKLLKKL